MNKILTNKNVIDPGFNVLAAILFLTPYVLILTEKLDPDFPPVYGIPIKVIFYCVLHFFPAISFLAISQVLANEKWAEWTAKISYFLFTVSVSALAIFIINVW